MAHFFARTWPGLLATAFSLLTFGATAQSSTSPQVAKVTAARSNSTFLLGNISYASKTQSLYSPNDLAGAAPGRISRLYFMYGSTGIAAGNTLTKLTIKLGQTTGNSFSGVRFFPDSALTPVLAQPSYTIAAGTSGDWFSIHLDSTFAYDPTQTLILQISFENSTATNFGTFGSNNSSSNTHKLYADTDTATTGSPSSGTWQHFGFDLGPLGLPAAAGVEPLTVFPNPAHGFIHAQDTEAPSGPAQIALYDAAGRLVRQVQVPAATLRSGYALPLRDVVAGTYQLVISQAGRVTRRPVVVY